jgi:hypothetical protein
MFQLEAITDRPSDVPMRIVCYPFRFDNIVTIEITAKTEDYCVISLSEPLGTIRRMIGVNLKKGLNSIPIPNLEKFSAGSYTLDIKNYDGKSLYMVELTKQ